MVNFIKTYLPRAAVAIFVSILLSSNIADSAFYASKSFGLPIGPELIFPVLFISTVVLVWIFFGLVTQIASSLGYRKNEDRELVVTGDGNIIHVNKDNDEVTRRHDAGVGFQLQAYELEAPLGALQQGRARLLEHISGLRNSSIVNLFIGILIALTGIIAIASTFFEIEKYANPEKGFDTSSFLLFVFLPRLSIALIVQVFSFFFLLMYRSNVQDVRYFQNEITNLDCTAAAVSLLRKENDQNVKTTISSLLKTERNRIIKKNQKVVSLPNDDEIMSKLVTIDNKVSKFTRQNAAKASEQN